MSFSHTIERGVLLSTLTATLTADDLLTLAEVAAAHDVGTAPDRITDLSRLTDIQVGFEEISDLVRRRKAAPLASPVRSALVAANPIQFGYARMFKTLNDRPEITLRIFGTLDEAWAWLDTPPDPDPPG